MKPVNIRIFAFEIASLIVDSSIRETRFIRDIWIDNVRAIKPCYPTQSQSTRRDGDFIMNATSSFYTISKRDILLMVTFR